MNNYIATTDAVIIYWRSRRLKLQILQSTAGLCIIFQSFVKLIQSIIMFTFEFPRHFLRTSVKIRIIRSHCPLPKALGIATLKGIVLKFIPVNPMNCHNISHNIIVVFNITYQKNVKVSGWAIICNNTSKFARTPRKGTFWADLGRACHRLVIRKSLGEDKI